MFRLNITEHHPERRLAEKTREAMEALSERMNVLSEQEFKADFVLYTSDGNQGVLSLSGVVMGSDRNPGTRATRLANRFILDSMQLEGTFLDLDAMDASIEEFVRHWYNEVSVSYGELLKRFPDLDAQTTVSV